MVKKVNPIVALVVAAVTIYLLFKLASFALSILSWLAIPLLLVTLFIKKDVVLDYGKWIIRSFQSNAIMGIAFTLLTIVGFPLVSLFLFVKALNYDKWSQIKSSMNFPRTGGADTEEADFEIIDEEPLILEERETIKRRNS